MLAAGTRLGPYEVLAAIGAGGMGEVYKARDTRLNRTVAIKILPSRLATNPVFRERFAREARTLSSIAHPNLCTLHDIGEVDGTHFIVMEYLEGETLENRLVRGALSLSDILRIAIETAEGLAGAHQRGIVHRDLKPGNIMLTKSGAKLLDFGLARDVSTAVAVAGISSASATTAQPLTGANTIVGTFQYMSPEQIGGREADHRSDVFAYGAMLYEMVTRRRAFGDGSQTSVIAAVLERAPVPVRSLRPETPCSIEAVINRCLEKDPTQRWQCMADLASELRRVELLSGERRRLAPPPRRSSRIERTGWAAAVLLLAVALVSFLLTKPPATTARVHTSILPPDNAWFALTGDQGGPVVISPDGQRLAFIALSEAGENPETRLFVRDLASGAPREIDGTSHAMFPFWKPDSSAVGFFADGQLRTVNIQASESPRTICKAPSARGGTWSDRGVILFAPAARDGLKRVSDAAGEPVAVTTVVESQHSTHRWPFFLPDGNHFLYTAADHAQPAEGSSIYFASLDGKTNKWLLPTNGNALYAGGYLMYVNGKKLLARRFDPSTGEFPADAETIAKDVLYDHGIWRGIFSVSNGGVLVYQPGGLDSGRSRLYWVDRHGTRVGAVGDTRVQLSVRIAGKYAAIEDCTPPQAATTPIGSDIWLVNLDTGLRQRLTTTADVSMPVWSPDGGRVAYARTTRAGQQGIFQKLVAGNAGDELLLRTTMPTLVLDWSPDGLVFMQNAGALKTRRDLWLLPLNGGPPRPLLQSPADESYGAISPDGRWIAYTSDASGLAEIYVAPFPSLTNPLKVSTAGGSAARWNPRGKELFFVSLDSTMCSAELRPRAETIEVVKITPMFRADLRSIFQGVAYDISPDGQRFLINTPAEDPNRPLTLIQNWRAEVNR